LVLQRALDDLDAWDEERASLVRVHLTNQCSWEDDRQCLLDTEVALRAEIQRMGQRHQEERRGDLAQVATMAEIRRDAAAVREHSEVLTARISELKAGLQKAEADAQAHVDALECCTRETAAVHAASQQRLDELQDAAGKLAQQLVELNHEHHRKLFALTDAHAGEMAAAAIAADARAAKELAKAKAELEAQHKAVMTRLQDDCREKIQVSADACEQQVRKIQDACRERVTMVEEQSSMEATEKEKNLQDAYKNLEKKQIEELGSMEREIVEQAARHKREAGQLFAEAASVLGEENRRNLAEQEERAKEEVAVLKEQLSALAQSRREEMLEASALNLRHAEQMKELELRHKEKMNGAVETVRKAEEQLRKTHERELTRVTERMQLLLRDAIDDQTAVADKAEKFQKMSAAAAANVQQLQDLNAMLYLRISEQASENSQLQAQLTATHGHASSGKEELAAERAKAAALGKKVEGLLLLLASKEAAEAHLKQVLQEARGDQQRLELQAAKP
jgi:hypothetical protein